MGKIEYLQFNILYSDESLRLFQERAFRAQSYYAFAGSERKVRWIVGEDAYLAPSGAQAVVSRIGIKNKIITEEELIQGIDSRVLIIPNAIKLKNYTKRKITEYAKEGVSIILSGLSDVNEIIPEAKTIKNAGGYIYVDPHMLPGIVKNIIPNSIPLILPGYYYKRYAAFQSGSINSLPYREHDSNKNYGIFIQKNIMVLTFQFFEQIGALLQGHTRIQFDNNDYVQDIYLELLCQIFYNHIIHFVPSEYTQVKIRPWKQHDAVMCIKHDTDYSDDNGYLDYEKKHGVPATYAVLDDTYAEHWINATRNIDYIEAGFHFKTNRTDFITRIMHKNKILPSLKAVAKKGIYRQLARMQRKYNVTFRTLHRHAFYIFYPEIIDALYYASAHSSHILGCSVMFRSEIHQYSAFPNNGKKIYVIAHPHTAVSLYCPYHVTYTSLEYYHILKSWELTHLIEPNIQLIQYIYNNCNPLPGGVYSVGFHPAHIKGKRLGETENSTSYLSIVEFARQNKMVFLNYKDIFEIMNECDQLAIIKEDNNIFLVNNSSHSVKNIYYEVNSAIHRINTLTPYQKEKIA